LAAFTMSEHVFLGEADQVAAFLAEAVASVLAWLQALKLVGRLETGHDPFFGRAADLLIEQQVQQNLKQELVLDVDADAEAACFSFNNHRDFFGQRWNIRDAGGGVAHSACVGVGLERLALAMFHRHGLELEAWPI
jgi:hypothetical protein